MAKRKCLYKSQTRYFFLKFLIYIFIGLYEPVKEITGGKTLLQKFLAGSISGGIGSVCGNPFDVLKTRMMATEGKGDASFGHHFNEILKN